MIRKTMNAISRMRDLGLGNGPLWTNARMVWADIPVDPKTVKDWLPASLKLAKPARASVFIADYPETSFGSVYREAAIILHVTLFGIPLRFCPWMVVDDDSALILGRELLGYPKKMADIKFREYKDGRFLGTVSRKGTEVFRISGRIGEEEPAPTPGIGHWSVNVRGLLPLALGHLLLFRPEERVHDCQRINGDVALSTSDHDELGIAAGPAENMTIRTCDIDTSLWRPPVPLMPVHPAYVVNQMTQRVL